MEKQTEIFPFVMGNKLVRIRGSGLNNALDRVLTRYPNKFIKTKFAKNMDIISAKVEAAKESKSQKKPFYVFVDKEGEADISSAPLAGTLHKFVDGVEVNDFKPGTLSAAPKEVKKTLPAQSDKAKELINKKENVMEKKTKAAPKKAAKKPTKAAPAKKVAAKIVGEKKSLTIKQIIELMNKGTGVYRQTTGGKLSIVHMKAAKNKDHTLDVTVVKAQKGV